MIALYYSIMRPDTTTLETERLYLKEMTPELFTHILTHDSDEEIKRYVGIDDERLEEKRGRLVTGMTSHYMSFKYFLLIEKATNTTLGTAGYYRWYPKFDRAELGYQINDAENRGKGLMREAAATILKFGFEEMKLHRIEAFASPLNTPSIKVLEGLGMKYEGLMREHFLKDGIYEDSAIYAILKHEYEQFGH